MIAMVRHMVLSALCLVLVAVPSSSFAADMSGLAQSLNESGSALPNGPSPFAEPEPVVTPSPATPAAFDLPAGTSVRDFEVAPTGDQVALIIENAAHRQQIAFWRFAATGWAGTIDVPTTTHLASLTWHPHGNALFLLANIGKAAHILRIETGTTRFAPATLYKSAKPLRRLVIGPRPFQIAYAKTPSFRLFFGEALPKGGYALRTVSEAGTNLYSVVAPGPLPDDPTKLDMPPNTLTAPSALPVAFHPAGNILIWEDGRKCLQALAYGTDNWGKSTPVAKGCNGITAYTPNGAATLTWTAKTAGLTLHNLIDKTDEQILGDYSFTALPAQTPDGRGIVDLTAADGKTTLRYLPIATPLADVVNAWMYMQSTDDQTRFAKDRGLFRTLPDNDQLYQLYDSESYACGEPDESVPTRPYLVTTDLFWEVYGAAFDGLFIVLEREGAIPAFKRLVDAAGADLAKNHAGTPLAKAFAAAQAVLEAHEADNAEARLILAAQGMAPSDALGIPVDYSEFKPRGHYTTDGQKRYFAAMRYLGQIKLSAGDVGLLRGLDPAVAQAAGTWIASYRPFIAASRLDLVWDDGRGKTAVAAHQGPAGVRMFPLSWAWDNEALDSAVYHSDRPAAEQITAPDGTKRLLPSGLDFATVAGNAAAAEFLKTTGEFARYPNLAPRLEATHRRFAADAHAKGSLYERWIDGLATQWSEVPAAPREIAGPLWNAKRLQTGLASWATLRHSTVLVNDKTNAECGEGGFEFIVLRPPRGYVEPDPASFGAIAALFDATIDGVRASPILTDDPAGDTQLRNGIVRRLAQSRDDARNQQSIAEKEIRGEALSPKDYQAIQYIGGTAEHNFLVFMSLSNPGYALSTPDPIMKIADVAGVDGGGAAWEAAIGRPLEWDQIVPFYGRREIVKGAVYSYYEFAAAHPMTDRQWFDALPKQSRPAWVASYVSNEALSCPATQQ